MACSIPSHFVPPLVAGLDFGPWLLRVACFSSGDSHDVFRAVSVPAATFALCVGMLCLGSSVPCVWFASPVL